jgi:hypothetical protein
MDAAKIHVDLVDHQFNGGGISGEVSSPELFKPIAFDYDDWRGPMLFNTKVDDTLYNSQLPWLDPLDALIVVEVIERVVVEYLRARFEQAA